MAEDKKAHLAVVPDPPPKPTADDLEKLGRIDLSKLENLDTEDLRVGMLKGIYLLQHCLFSQAGFEFKRLQKSRDLIPMIEETIFRDKEFQNLDESEKLRLYRMLMGNMNTSLEFLSNLQKNVAVGIDAVNSIDRMKADSGAGFLKPDEDQKNDIAAMKQLILQKIAEKAGVKAPKSKPKPKVKPKPKKKKKPKPKPKPPTDNS